MSDGNISETDLKLFKNLMNPAGLSLGDEQLEEAFKKIKHQPDNNVPQDDEHERLPPVIEEIEEGEQEVEKEEEEEEEEEEAADTKDIGVDIENDEDESGQEEEHKEPEENSDTRKKQSSLFEKTMHRYEKVPPSAFKPRPREEHKVPLRSLFEDTEYIPEDFTEIDVGAENADPRIRREKQEILFNLLKKYPQESKGQWNMKLPLFELKYEFQRRQQFETEQDQLRFMKEAMKLILSGIEVANNKFGPILNLDGWSTYITSDMSKYDRCLTALYHRYFRNKQMNPIMELLWLIVGSAAMWHIKSKFMMGGPPENKEAREESEYLNKQHDIRPPPTKGGKVPFDRPGAPKPDAFNLSSLLKLFTK